MSLIDFLAPVRDSIATPDDLEWQEQHLGARLRLHREVDGLPDLEGVKVALIGIVEDRGAPHNVGCQLAPDAIRHYLYRLSSGQWHTPLADLGNIYPGERLADSQEALKEVVRELLGREIIPVILGGSQDLTYANYRAYDALEQTVNLVSVDARFDLGRQNESLQSENYLSHVILKKPYLLFNYSNIGYQTYFAHPEEIALMERMYFDIHRLGHFRNTIHEAEPVIRDADIVSVDISAIRQSDAPGNGRPSPNGFSGEEACAICRYAGLSDKVSSFGLYEVNPRLDQQGQTSHLAAQMLWYFIEGVNGRKGDYPFARKQDYQRFTVLIDDGEHELVFYKSPLSDRWWIEVPLKTDQLIQHERHRLIPCSEEDYRKATENEIPLRWWQAMKKTI